MTPARRYSFAALLLIALASACSDEESSTGASSPASSGAGASTSGSTGGSTGEGGSAGNGSGGSPGTGGSVEPPSCGELQGFLEAYGAAHPGQDGDVNNKTPEEIAADPDAQALMALCGADQRPVIPLLAWEYGGSDHAWISPEASALFYCVYTPVDPATDHWAYDEAADHVSADVYIGCPELNPCKDEVDAQQVLACLGDPSNIEIIIDLASYNDGMDVGFDLSEASTDLFLLVRGGGEVLLFSEP